MVNDEVGKIVQLSFEVGPGIVIVMVPSVSFPLKENDFEFLLNHFTSTSPHHFLFDCDGLMLDTEPVYSRVGLSVIQELLLSACDCDHQLIDNFPPELKIRIMGCTRFEVAKRVAEFMAAEFGVAIEADRWVQLTVPREEEAFACGEFGLMPGVGELVGLLAGQLKWPLAVATSSTRAQFTAKTSHPHIAPLFTPFTCITCGDDADSTTGSPLKGKPHPAIFEAAKSKLVVGGEGVVLEDSVNGVVAGLRSGHKCIWVQADQSITFEHLLDAIEALGIAHEIDCSRVWVYRAESLNEIVSVIKALL